MLGCVSRAPLLMASPSTLVDYLDTCLVAPWLISCAAFPCSCCLRSAQIGALLPDASTQPDATSIAHNKL